MQVLHGSVLDLGGGELQDRLKVLEHSGQFFSDEGAGEEFDYFKGGEDELFLKGVDVAFGVDEEGEPFGVFFIELGKGCGGLNRCGCGVHG